MKYKENLGNASISLPVGTDILIKLVILELLSFGNFTEHHVNDRKPNKIVLTNLCV
jgi:hypothetical protein